MDAKLKSKLEELYAKSATNKLLANIEFYHAERFAHSIAYAINSVQWHTPNSLCFDELYKRIEANEDHTMILEGKNVKIDGVKATIYDDKSSDILLIARRSEGKESNNPIIQVVLL